MLKGLSAIYAVAGMIDLGQTLYGTSNGLQEGNPILGLLVDTPVILAITKILVTLLVVWLFSKVWKQDGKKGRWVVWFGAIFQTLVVVSNFIMIGIFL